MVRCGLWTVELTVVVAFGIAVPLMVVHVPCGHRSEIGRRVKSEIGVCACVCVERQTFF